MSYQAIVQLIAATTITTGLKVRCKLNRNTYQAGINVSNAEIYAIHISRHDFNGDWNYTINPKALAAIITKRALSVPAQRSFLTTARTRLTK